MWFRPGIHCFSEKLIFLRYGEIRPQLGRLLGIEFVRFPDLLIEDVRIAVVSTSAWQNAFRTPVFRRSLVARPWRKSRNRKFSTLAFALMRSTASRGRYNDAFFDPSHLPLYASYPIGAGPPGMSCEDEFRMVPAQGQQNIARSAGDGRLDHAAAFPGAAADIGARGFPSGS